MIKKLLLTFSFIVLVTITYGGTTYMSQAGEKIIVSEELAITLTILKNLYNEGVITEEEFSSAKSMLLDPVSTSGKKTKKNLTAAERKQLKEAEENKLKAQKKLLREEAKAEREKIKQACVDEYNVYSSDTTFACTLEKLTGKTSKTDKTSKGDMLKCFKGTAAERKAAEICQ